MLAFRILCRGPGTLSRPPCVIFYGGESISGPKTPVFYFFLTRFSAGADRGLSPSTQLQRPPIPPAQGTRARGTQVIQSLVIPQWFRILLSTHHYSPATQRGPGAEASGLKSEPRPMVPFPRYKGASIPGDPNRRGPGINSASGLCDTVRDVPERGPGAGVTLLRGPAQIG